MEGRISWSGLPEELCRKIGQCLDARFDIIRFRSVCKTWRNSLPFSHPRNWYLQMKPFNFNDGNARRYFFIVGDNSSNKELSSSIIRSTVYILRQYPTPDPVPTPWLFKLEENEQGKLRVVNPISDAPVKDLPSNFPKVLNLLDYPILEVNRGVSKAVILPESDLISKDAEITVLFLCPSGRLLLWRNVDDRLVKINRAGCYYDDIAVYRGRFVAVDRWGIVSFVDSSFRLVQYTPPVLNGGHKKHLVVSSEHLYVVDRYFDRPRITLHYYSKRDAKAVVGFKLFKLDEDYGWIGKLSSFPGCSDLLWPPPSWFTAN
ncbi:hypothetical protein V6N13_111678 [Hibiscus sabdariffa]|uniref:F-box protein n=1 Tax=Hibiscus sabdariffa TaxID=183260 RepID=A0ABR2TL04_9ROSI